MCYMYMCYERVLICVQCACAIYVACLFTFVHVYHVYMGLSMIHVSLFVCVICVATNVYHISLCRYGASYMVVYVSVRHSCMCIMYICVYA